VAALLVLSWVCFAGALLARRLDPGSRFLTETFALGSAVGLGLFAGFGFILGWGFGLSTLTVVAAAVLVMATGLVLGARPKDVLAFAREKRRPSTLVLVLCVVSIAIVARLADRTLFVTEAGIASGDRHNFGDLPFHMAIAAGFAYGENFPPAHPELAGVPLTYPFFCDLISGMVMVLGGSWRDAFFWPTFILGLSVLVAMARFGEAIAGSRSLGRVAAALTFLSGGLGFLTLDSGSAIEKWWQAGPDLTMNDAGYRYANFVTTLFIPQRSILFGWPLLLFALAFLVEDLRTTNETRAEPIHARPWFRAGLLGSLLPLIHSHSFAVLCFSALFLVTRKNLKAALEFTKGVLPLALPAVLFMATHNSLSTGRFFEWHLGFDGGGENPLLYWLLNAGVFLPLAAIGIVHAPTPVRFAAAPFAALFLLANLFRLNPWIWDNMKFLAPSHAGLAPFAATALAVAWRRGPWGRTAASFIFLLAILSGALDVSKVMLAGGRFHIFENADLVFAQRVRETAPATMVILTAPDHNHPVLLSGRRVFMGYEGHLWSQGLDYEARKSVAAAVFRGERQDPNVRRPMVRIDAIALTPKEGALVEDTHALEALPSLVESPYRLVKIR
jgi:hypothetical protein